MEQPTPTQRQLLAWKHDYAFDTVREDGRLERHCAHGVGHTVGHLRGYLVEGWESVHGCDRCCASWPRMEIRPATSRTSRY